VRLVPDRLDSPVGAALVTALLADLVERYNAPDEEDGLNADQLAPPAGIFLVAWNDDDDAIGCGGFRRIDDQVAEIKRMYVVPDARRAGVARAVLLEIEARARALGYSRLILETGTKQPEAMRLYETNDYEPMEPFGAYRDSPLSRCYTKTL
jgi:putative acetyltransferase